MTTMTPLADACRTGDSEAAFDLLDVRGADPDEPACGAERGGPTPLFLAACVGNAEIARMLLDAGAEPDAAMAGWTPLGVACVRGDMPVAALLAAAGADPDRAQAGIAGLPPLHLAALVGNRDIVQTLAAAGADIDGGGDGGRTPLMAATVAESLGRGVGALETLVGLGADVRARVRRSGTTALHIAARYGRTGAIRRLAAAGAELEAGDIRGFVPMHYAAGMGCPRAVRALAAAGADPNGGRGVRGMRPVHTAAAFARTPAALEALRACGADMDVRADGGRSALMLAAGAGRVANVEWLLLASTAAVRDGTDADGNTALHAAAYRGHPRCASALLRGGARPDVANATGATPTALACEHGQRATVRILAAAGADPNAGDGVALRAACGAGSARTVALLLGLGAHATAEALAIAAQADAAEAVELLLAAGARPSERIASAGGLTAVTAAILGRAPRAVALLMRHPRTKIGMLDGMGHAPVHAAALAGEPRILECVLHTRGVKAAARTADGRTAVHCAVTGPGARAILPRLIAVLGSDALAACDSAGHTALWLARSAGNVEAAKILSDAGCRV